MQRSTRVSLLRIGIGFVLFIIAVFLQIAARNYRGFADWYTDTVYPFWVETIGKFWSFFPYSVVELLLYGLLLGLGVMAWNRTYHKKDEAVQRCASYRQQRPRTARWRLVFPLYGIVWNQLSQHTVFREKWDETYDVYGRGTGFVL